MKAKLWEGQGYHVFFLVLLVMVMFFFYVKDPTISYGSFLGFKTWFWFFATIGIPVIHQVYVLICWRLELYSKRLTTIWGNHAFKRYRIGFTILILCRPISILILAWSNKGTIAINTVIRYSLSVVFLALGLYLLYSVKRYFGLENAFGKDHFNPDLFKNKSLETKGIFKYTKNGMYVFGFLLIWIPGLLWQSKAGLLAALFNHLYIWVHYYFTEKPVMKTIYVKGVKL